MEAPTSVGPPRCNNITISRKRSTGSPILRAPDPNFKQDLPCLRKSKVLRDTAFPYFPHEVAKKKAFQIAPIFFSLRIPRRVSCLTNASKLQRSTLHFSACMAPPFRYSYIHTYILAGTAHGQLAIDDACLSRRGTISSKKNTSNI